MFTPLAPHALTPLAPRANAVPMRVALPVARVAVRRVPALHSPYRLRPPRGHRPRTGVSVYLMERQSSDKIAKYQTPEI
jgi:hypothetical protein